jgi:hypothetical protein
MNAKRSQVARGRPRAAPCPLRPRRCRIVGAASTGRCCEGVHGAVSRRTFITSVVSGSALAAVSFSQILSALTSPVRAASPAGDMVGKITVGYQGWFACPGDGAPINGWWH